MNFRLSGSSRSRRTLSTAGAAALALGLGVAVAGCGEITNTITPNPGTENQVTVELSGAPSAYDVGIYAAQALGYFKQTDMKVTIETPSAGQNPLTMLHNERVLIAISSEPSVFLARNLGEPVVSVGALVQRPFERIKLLLPKQTGHGATGGQALAGTTTTGTTTTSNTATQTATYTGTTTTGAGTTTTGGATSTTGTLTNATPTVDQVATASLWPAKLKSMLRQKDALRYQSLVIVVRKGTIVDHAPLIRRFVQAVARGYKAVRANPAAGVADLVAAVPSLANQTPTLIDTVNQTMPDFFPSGTIWGWQSEAQWNSFGTWLTKHGLITNPNAVTDASTNELLAGEGV